MRSSLIKNSAFLGVLSLLLVVSFVFASLFGVHITMMKNADGSMPHCPFTSDTGKVCDMNVVAHINGWQQLFLAVSEKGNMYLLLAVFALAVGFFVLKNLRRFVFSSLSLISPARGSPPGIFGNYLQQSIGSGVFHKRE